MATVLFVIKSNSDIYLLTIILGILVPYYLPATYHSHEELDKYKSKREMVCNLLWKDMLMTISMGLIVVTLMIEVTNFSKTLHNPFYFLAGFVSLVLWAIIYINIQGRKK